MHDGSLQTLEDVVDYYDKGGSSANRNLDAKIKPLHLGAQEKKDLAAFLEGIERSRMAKYHRSGEFPE